MRVAELFAGVGGMALGLKRAGMQTMWLAEIDPFCQRVLRARFSGVPVYGDVTQLDGHELVRLHGAVDLLAGGSPCQDLSVAGKRAGLRRGERSSLFYHQIRIWHESGADLCLWENVGGALSSHDGKDFGRVLSAFVGCPITVPRRRRRGERESWPRAGVVSGPTGVASWRCLDAQWVGLDGRAAVPQRRFRVFVLGSRTGRVDPAEVLLELEGMFGNPPSRRKTGEGPAAGPRVRAASESDGSVAYGFNHKNGGGYGNAHDGLAIVEEGVGPLDRSTTKAVVAVPLDMRQLRRGETNTKSGRGGESITSGTPGTGIGDVDDPAYTLGAEGGAQGVIAFEPRYFSRGQGAPPGEIAGTLNANARRGDASTHVVAFNIAIDSEGNTSEDVHGSLVTHHSPHNRGAVLAFDLAQVTHPENRSTPSSELSPTLNQTGGVHVFNETGHEAREAHTLVAGSHHAKGDRGERANLIPTLGIPRRLMPVECERLMGWEDGWTNVPDEKTGKAASDSQRYKACGNGVVAHVSEWIGRRLLAAAGGNR